MRLKSTILSTMGCHELRTVVAELQLKGDYDIDLRSKSSMGAALARTRTATPAVLLQRLTAESLGKVAKAFGIPPDLGRVRLLEDLLQADQQPALPRQRPTPAQKTRFVAIDFETADYYRDSACAVAICRVEDDAIVEQQYHLIRPPRRQFFFSHIHGITWNQVAPKPAFAELWPRLLPLLHGCDFLAAHNAPFDRSVLNSCCAAAGLSPPAIPFLCTVRLARQVWQLNPAKLPDVCRHLRIALIHHHAASDAEACARIVIAARRASGGTHPAWARSSGTSASIGV